MTKPNLVAVAVFSQSHTPIQLCPKCGEALDAVTNATGFGGPKEGDCSICLYCGAILEYGPGLSVHVAELSQLPTDFAEKLLRMQNFILLRRKDNPLPKKEQRPV